MKTGFGRARNARKCLLPLLPATLGVCVIFAAAAQSAAAQAPVLFPWMTSTIAGNGSNGSSGNGGAATAAELSTDIRAVAVDGQGNVYFVDGGNNEVREVNAASGVISIVAGGGTICAAAEDEAGDNCVAATQTKLNGPRGLSVDAAGNIYIAGYSDEFVHKIDAQTGIMTRIAGVKTDAKHYGTKGYSGDGGLATNAALNQPRGVAVDKQGNIWICDTSNNVIRKIDATTGIITTAVGAYPGSNTTAPAGWAGDGSAANSSAVELNEPTDIAFDSKNNAYIADFNNKVIRKVTASTNIISTIIGTNYSGSAPTTAPAFPAAATTELGSPTKLAVDAQGNVYFADSGVSVIYFYDASANTITAIAGQYGYAGTATGFSTCSDSDDALGDGCPGTQALFYQGSSALGMAIDAQNNLYITDPADARIRKVSTDLSFPATAVQSATTQTVEIHYPAGSTPKSVAPQSTYLFQTPSAPACTANSDATTTCTVSVNFVPPLPGLLTDGLGVTTGAGTTYFPLSGVGQGSLLTIDPGTISFVTGTTFSSPGGMATDAAQNVYIADTGNNRVVESSSSAVTVIAGTGTAGYTGDGSAAASATLSAPAAVAVGANGVVYIADTGNNVIRAVNTSTGVITTVAGGASSVCAYAVDTQGDGCPATQATLKAPQGVLLAPNGDLFIADTGDNLIRRVDALTGDINLFSGTVAADTCSSATDNYGDGCPLLSASTVFNGPTGLAIDASNNIYVADTGNNVIRELNPGTGLVTLVAGNGQSTFTGDGGAATAASLNGPTAIAVDGAGDIYIADTGNAVIRLVNRSTGTISSLLGLGGTAGSSAAASAASELLLTTPRGIAIPGQGVGVYVADSGNNRVVLDSRVYGLLAFGSSNQNTATPAQTATLSNIGNGPLTFATSPVYSASGNTADFTIDTSAATACAGAGTLTGGESCTLAAAFDPTELGALTDTLTVGTTSGGGASLALTGKGVLLANTTTTLTQTSPSGALTYGESATFTATVAPATGTGTPTGTIVFTVDGTRQPSVTLSSSGTATLTVTLPVGSHTLGASYSGDDNFAPSSTTLAAPVAQAATTTTLTITPTTQIQLQPVSFSATVASSTTGVPTGTVNFVSGGTVLGSGTLNAQGVATFTTSSLAIASYSVTAVYAGDPNYATSTSAAVSLTVNPIPPGMIVTASPASLQVPQGGSVQTTLTVTPQGGLTGTVTLSCAGLPANSVCNFYPTTLNLGGSPTAVPSCTATSPAACTVLTIATNVPPVSLSASARRGTAGIAVAVLFPALLLGFGGLFAPGKFALGRRGARWMALLAVVAFSGLALVSGCATNPTQKAASPTPIGQSTVVVTFTGQGNVTQTQTISLTVVAPTPVTAEARPLPAMAKSAARAIAVIANPVTR